ncbi:MAG: hypothetical protein ROO73_04350 [Roseivirga sp.]
MNTALDPGAARKKCMAKVPPPDYQQFVKEIKLKVHEAQCQALRAVNKNLIQLYWDIGQAIVEK